jgi:hypothetical protein
MFKKAVAAIGAVWNRIFDGASRLKARAANLEKAAGAVSGEAKGPTFENQTLAENLHINGTVDAKAAAAAIVAESNELAALTERSIKFAEGTISAMTAGPQQETQSFTTIIKSAKDLATGGFSKVADAASVGISQPEETELFKGKALPGNKAIIAIVPASTDQNDEKTGLGLRHSGYKLGIFDASKKVAEKAALKTLSAADIGAIAKQMGEAADKVLAYKAEQKKAEGVAKEMIATCEKISGETMKANVKADFGDDSETKRAAVASSVLGWANGKVGQAIAKCAVNMVLNVAPQVAGYVLNAGGSVLQYGEQSVKQYGKTKEEKKPEAAAAAA